MNRSARAYAGRCRNVVVSGVSKAQVRTGAGKGNKGRPPRSARVLSVRPDSTGVDKAKARPDGGATLKGRGAAKPA
jgi:hypothetical protein